MNLFVEEQIELGNEEKKKGKKKFEILVFAQTPFCIKFLASNKNINLAVKEKEKMKDVFERYAEKAKVNLKQVFFLYNSKNYFYEEIGDLTVFDMANKEDKEVKVMSVTVNELVRMNSMEEEEENVPPEYPVEQDNIINTDNDYEPKKPLIHKEPESPETYAKKWFYTKSLFIIII